MSDQPNNRPKTKAVLELTVLRTPPSPDLPDPEAITKALQQVRALLAKKVHPTNSKFYIRVEDAMSSASTEPREFIFSQPSPSVGSKYKPLSIYILGTWPSIPTHLNFLQNEKLREQVLGAQEGILEFVSGAHYAPLPKSPFSISMDALPIKSPIVVLTIFYTPLNGPCRTHLAVVNKYDELVRRNQGLWLLDDENGEVDRTWDLQSLVVSGWDSVREFREWLDGPLTLGGVEWEGRFEDVRDGVEVVILRDLEGGV